MFGILQVTGPPLDPRNLKNFLLSRVRIRMYLSLTSSRIYSLFCPTQLPAPLFLWAWNSSLRNSFCA